jgi:hypothetical protein
MRTICISHFILFDFSTLITDIFEYSTNYEDLDHKTSCKFLYAYNYNLIAVRYLLARYCNSTEGRQEMGDFQSERKRLE